jgi:hypothetical protein
VAATAAAAAGGGAGGGGGGGLVILTLPGQVSQGSRTASVPFAFAYFLTIDPAGEEGGLWI